MLDRQPDNDEDTLAEAFWSVARRLRQANREALEPWEIAPSHARVLAVLVRHGPSRLSKVAQHLHIAPRSTTEVIDGLAERGLVERRPDPDDRRATLVALTDRGAEVATAIQTTRREAADRFFGSLGADDQAELTRILRALRD
ncbi:MarR family winged helix-turn-helix transcriptional regulator [Plantactinospora siamensis]|uniref:MarR family winged helix-turn-helix transcriptional regulator n=1 Tax=Plantactinospora siamensis TaxID=555372 RepID=A0ABV6P5U7_9ACTN